MRRGAEKKTDKEGGGTPISPSPGRANTSARPPRTPSAKRRNNKKSENLMNLLKTVSTKLILQDEIYVDGLELPEVVLSGNVQTVREAIEASTSSEETAEIDEAALNSALEELAAIISIRNDQHAQAVHAYFAKQDSKNAELVAEIQKMKAADSSTKPTPVNISGAGGSGGAESIVSVESSGAVSIREAKIGLQASSIDFVREGGVPQKSDFLTKLNALSDEPTSESLTACRELLKCLSSKNVKGAEDAITALYEAANVGIGEDSSAIGTVPVAEAIRLLKIPLASGAAAGGRVAGGSSRSSASVETKSAILRVGLRPIDEIQAEIDIIEIEIDKGECTGLPRSTYNDQTKIRDYFIGWAFSTVLDHRQKVQNRITLALLAVIKSMGDQFERSAEIKVCELKYIELLEAKTSAAYLPEMDTAAVTPGDVFVARYKGNLNLGSNFIAELRHIFRDPCNIGDIEELAAVLAQWHLGPFEQPAACIARLNALSKALPVPNVDQDWAAIGFIIGIDGRFKCVDANSAATAVALGMRKRTMDSGMADARTVFTPAVYSDARAGTFTSDKLAVLNSRLESEHIMHTPKSPHGGANQGAAFGAFGSGGGGGGGAGKSICFNYQSGSCKFGANCRFVHSGSIDPAAAAAAVAAKAASAKVFGGGGLKRPPPIRKASIAPGEKTGLDFYTRAIEILGSKFCNLVPVLELVQAYFKATKKIEPFHRVGGAGAVKIPLQLASNFAWKGNAGNYNFDCRRDIYGLWLVLRDLMS